MRNTAMRWMPGVLALAVAGGGTMLAAEGRVTVRLGPNALPEQMVIAAADRELPLDARGSDAAREAALPGIGRGPQLRAPMRLEIVRDGQTGTVEPVTPAKTVGAEARAELQSGETRIEVAAQTDGGRIDVSVAYGGGRVDSLALVIEPAGMIDFALAGAAGPDMDAAATRLRPGEGRVWSCAGGVPRHLFAGSGDRGWTLLAGDPAGWLLDAGAPASTLTREADGSLTWRIFLVNTPQPLDRTRTAQFSLLTHPQRLPPPDGRRQAWLAWPHAGAPVAAPEATRASCLTPPTDAVVWRADVAAIFEARGGYAVLGEGSGGDALDATRNVVTRYPAPLFRFLAGTHAGQVRRIEGNSGRLTAAGANRALDRALLGRALVNDIGIDAAALAHPADGARVLGILARFGAFDADGETEVIPWWRTPGVLRFGEGAGDEDAFALAPGAEDPAAWVRVAVYRRPVRRGAAETRTLIVLFNEHADRVRDQLYVLQPERVFGGRNVLKDMDVASDYDFSRMPEHNDWSKATVVLENRARTDAVMRDEEDGGVVRRVAARDGVETYGPMIAISGRDFRILHGRGQ